jgi:hypothetical protein
MKEKCRKPSKFRKRRNMEKGEVVIVSVGLSTLQRCI